MPLKGAVWASGGVLGGVVVRSDGERTVLGAQHGHVSLRVDVRDLAVVVAVPVNFDGLRDEALPTELQAGVEALAVAAALAALRTPGRFPHSPVLARGQLEWAVVGADDGDSGVTVDVGGRHEGVVVAAIVQCLGEVDELGSSFFAGGGAVVQGGLQELVSWAYAPASGSGPVCGVSRRLFAVVEAP